MSIKTQELKETAEVPSKEGLIMDLEGSLLFRLDPHTPDLDLVIGAAEKLEGAVGRPPLDEGARADARHLLVADGRSSASRGLTNPQLANQMVHYGAVDAMAFDAGGSTEIAFNGQVLNNPSDGRERLIAGDTPAEALRHAQRRLMRDERYASPLDWAPFIVVGDGL